MIVVRVEAEKPVHPFNYIHTINTTNKKLTTLNKLHNIVAS